MRLWMTSERWRLRIRRASRLVCPWARGALAAQLRDGHTMQDGVDATVAAGVVAMADRLDGPFGG